MVRNKISTLRKGVDESHTLVGYSQICTITTTLGAIHKSALGAIAIVENFGRKAGQNRTLIRLKFEGGNSGAVLTEVDNQSFSLTKCNLLILSIFTHNNNLTISLLGSPLYAIVDVGFLRQKSKVVTKGYVGPLGRDNLARKLAIFLRHREFFGGFEAQLFASVILLTIEDSCVGHRARNARNPILQVCTVELG